MVLVITGPTGVGKTDIGVILARKFDLDIISADSRQVYRYLDIGTAKPSLELRREIKFHMIDCVAPAQEYSAADFARDALKIMRELRAKGRGFIVVGGAGFYLRALFQPFFEVPRANKEIRAKLQAESTEKLYARLQQIDPKRANQLHPNDRQRIMRSLEVYELTGRTFSELTRTDSKTVEFLPFYVVLDTPRVILYQRIEKRFDEMMAAGFLDEVKRLQAQGWDKTSTVANTYGYSELLGYLNGSLSLDEAVKLAKRKTKDYARRQLTWLRSLKQAIWMDASNVDDTVRRIEMILLDLLADKF